jgi:hypothetical protein
VQSSNSSGLPVTHRGIHFNGSDTAYMNFGNNFTLGTKFSLHSWVYAFNETNRSSEMTLFTKTETSNAGGPEWHNHLALRVDSGLNFKITLGYNSSPNISDRYTSVTSSANALVENTWTYVTYYLYLTNSNQVNLQMHINSS